MRTPVFQGLRSWYRAWVEMREARYRYLSDILDGIANPYEGDIRQIVRSEPERIAEKQDGAS